MQYSGILVLLRTADFEAGVEGLRELEDVEVHHEEPASGRVVVVAETDSLRGQEEVLGRIRRVPGVVVAEPAYYYRPDEDGEPGDVPEGSGMAGARPGVEEEGS